jgi:haloalkane dehalogenase
MTPDSVTPTTSSTPPLDTSWLDRAEYPFASNYIAMPQGRMHYLDEGQGHPLVMVHGIPTWSFLYRHLVRGLAPSYRCIVPDHIGFGLSDKPHDWNYPLPEQAANLAHLIDHLGLRDITLVVHDFGGAIGLSYALAHPENVRGIVLMNTWLWSQQDDPRIQRADRIIKSPLGRWLYKGFNAELRWLLPAVVGRKERFPKAVHQHYLKPFPRAQDRHSLWSFARQLIGASDWYEQLWQQRDRIVDKPTLVLWGTKDPLLQTNLLDRWKTVLTRAQFEIFSDTGHLVQEEQGADLLPYMRDFLHSLY